MDTTKEQIIKIIHGNRGHTPNVKTLRYTLLSLLIVLGATCLYLTYQSWITCPEPYRHPDYKPVTTMRLLQRPVKKVLAPKTRQHSSPKPSSQSSPYFKVMSNLRYHLCDTLEISIVIVNNSATKTASNGGDVIWAWIYNKELRASAAADVILDHKNGTYTARFQLHWTGKTTIAVSLVKSKVEVSVLENLRDSYPARCSYKGKFHSGNITKETPCHITTDMYINDTKTKVNNRTFCNFTDEKTGFPWFCVAPDILPCDTYGWHSVTHEDDPEWSTIESSMSKKLRPIGSSNSVVDVQHSPDTAIVSECQHPTLQECSMRLAPRPPNSAAGFYYQDQWYSLVCNNKHFQVPEALVKIRKCFQNHTLNFWGDSTIRQWYEYFADVLQSALDEHKAKNDKFGPHVAVDKTYNITFHYLHHGYPVRIGYTPTQDIHYVSNMIDGIKSGGKEIVLLTLWAHFTNTNLQFYRQRWEVIKHAMERLKLRAPNARVIIKSANTREFSGAAGANWFAVELDKVMRDMMSGMDGVTIIDVWDMTVGHRTGYHIHPKREVISQEIDMLLSFLCHETI